MMTQPSNNIFAINLRRRFAECQRGDTAIGKIQWYGSNLLIAAKHVESDVDLMAGLEWQGTSDSAADKTSQRTDYPTDKDCHLRGSVERKHTDPVVPIPYDIDEWPEEELAPRDELWDL